MNQEKKLTGQESWIRFRNRVIAGLGIFALITLYFSFYFVGPIKVTVIDAKTDKPIAGISVLYTMTGDTPCLSPGGCMGWGDDREGYTDIQGKFKVPLSIGTKIPFIMTQDAIRKISINTIGKNSNYDDYQQEFAWFPFRSFTFVLVPIPETLDDCRDNLTEDEQYRCVKMLARKDAREIVLSEDYLMSKYLHILNNHCDKQRTFDHSLGECSTVLAIFDKDKNICLSLKNYKYGYGGWDRCIFTAALDLQDKTWCEELPSENMKDYPVHYNITREKCEETIDSLTAEKK